MKPFRRNVCAVLVDGSGRRVLVFRRADALFSAYRWQFPQGGLKPDEAPEAGLLRELEEEIGTADVELLRRAPRAIRYVYPPDVVAKLKADGSKLARFRGQAQHWFLARLKGGTAAIHFENEPREFEAFRWTTPAQIAREVVPFKREAYVQGLTALGLLTLPKRKAAPKTRSGKGSKRHSASGKRADRRTDGHAARPRRSSTRA